MSVNSVSINDQMPVFAYERLKQVFGSIERMRVSFLGVSYRGDVGDTRFTPVESLVRLVQSDNANVKFHDPYVSYWQELSCEVESDIDIVFCPSPDLVIISTAHSEYKKSEFIDKIIEITPCKIFDAVGLFSDEQIKHLSVKHDVSVLGRGDVN